MMYGRRPHSFNAKNREYGSPSEFSNADRNAPVVSICPSCGCHLDNFGPFAFGNIAIDDCGEIRFEGVAMNLPRSQYVIVESLMRAKGRGLTRGLLANALGDDLDESAIPKYIERVRRSFQEIVPAFDQIAALRGFGAYRWAYRKPESRCPNQ